jgi:preprotein translocase subunit SecE
MATKKKGQLTAVTEWAKHLRKEYKRIFWKSERQAEKSEINKEFQSKD